MNNTNNELMKQLFNLHNIDITNEQIEKFNKFYELLIEYNKSFNLTAITNYKDVILKHFIDSVINYKEYTENAYICDIGTGAGFPGIPLKIMRPDLKLVLVDSLNKRVNFLNIVIENLKLTDIETIHSRAQELTNFVSHETFDYTISRAVAPLNILLELCIPYTKINGEMLAFKSLNTENEIQNAKNALRVLNCKISNIENYILNGDEKYKRKIVHIIKTASTDKQYPRLKNKIKQNPL